VTVPFSHPIFVSPRGHVIGHQPCKKQFRARRGEYRHVRHSRNLIDTEIRVVLHQIADPRSQNPSSSELLISEDTVLRNG